MGSLSTGGCVPLSCARGPLPSTPGLHPGPAAQKDPQETGEEERLGSRPGWKRRRHPLLLLLFYLLLFLLPSRLWNVQSWGQGVPLMPEACRSWRQWTEQGGLSNICCRPLYPLWLTGREEAGGGRGPALATTLRD